MEAMETRNGTTLGQKHVEHVSHDGRNESEKTKTKLGKNSVQKKHSDNRNKSVDRREKTKKRSWWSAGTRSVSFSFIFFSFFFFQNNFHSFLFSKTVFFSLSPSNFRRISLGRVSLCSFFKKKSQWMNEWKQNKWRPIPLAKKNIQSECRSGNPSTPFWNPVKPSKSLGNSIKLGKIQ